MFMFIMSAVVLGLGLSLMLALSPLALGLWVLILSMSISILMGVLYSSWFGFILFLIYIGGMLVMFAYFVAIQPNQQFNLKMCFFFSFLVFISSLANNYPIMSFIFSKSGWFISSLYEVGNISVIILLGFVLFLALVMVVKITTLMAAPLRPFLT